MHLNYREIILLSCSDDWGQQGVEVRPLAVAVDDADPLFLRL